MTERRGGGRREGGEGGGGVAGLGGGVLACQGDSSDLSQLLSPDRGGGAARRNLPVTTHEVPPVRREREKERESGRIEGGGRGRQQVRGEAALHATRRVADPLQDGKKPC